LRYEEIRDFGGDIVGSGCREDVAMARAFPIYY
jgi:hypothetical protein